MLPRFMGYFLLFLMIVFPTVPELLYVKAALFIFLSVCVTFNIFITDSLGIDRRILLGTLFFSFVGLFWATKGAIVDAVGAKKQAQVYVLWPCIYAILLAGVSSTRGIVGLQRALGICGLLLGIYGTGYVLSQLGLIPELLIFNPFPGQEQIVNLDEGFIESKYAGLTSLAYFIPFIMATLIGASQPESSIPRFWLWLTLGMLLALVFASGKRSLILVAGLTPLIVFSLRLFQPAATRLNGKRNLFLVITGISAIVCGVLFYLASSHAVTPSVLFDMVAEGFAFTEADSASSRYQQFYALLEGWYEQPFLGAGHGTSVSYIRSDTMPWSYELFYLALLYQTGLIGLTLYAAGIAWTYWVGIRIIRHGGLWSDIILPNLAGLTGVLIANGTNPYLVRFDGLWVIFISIAIINGWFLDSRLQAPEVN